MNAVEVEPDGWIHLPCNCGVRLKATDKRMTGIGPMSGPIGEMSVPMVVTEAPGGFRAVRSDRPLKVHVEGNKVELTGENLRASNDLSSLATAVDEYRKAQPPAAKRSKGRRRFNRAVTLDMMLPEGRIGHTCDDAVRFVFLQPGFSRQSRPVHAGFDDREIRFSGRGFFAGSCGPTAGQHAQTGLDRCRRPTGRI